VVSQIDQEPSIKRICNWYEAERRCVEPVSSDGRDGPADPVRGQVPAAGPEPPGNGDTAPDHAEA
jgi:hypothetical protein